MLPIFDGDFLPTMQVPTKIDWGNSAAANSIVYLNIYNLSPHRLYFSLTLGNPDICLPPNYGIEGLYLGKQGGSTLTVGQNLSSVTNISITKITTQASLQTISGSLLILGFSKDENWQGVRPLLTSSLAPSQGSNVAQQLINLGNPPLTPVITTQSTPLEGGLNFNNDGSGFITLFSNNAHNIFVNLGNGTASTPAVATFGYINDASDTTFSGILQSVVISNALTTLATVGNNINQWQFQVDATGNLLINDLSNGKQWVFGINNNFTIPAGLIVNATQINRPIGTHQSGYASGQGKAAGAGDIWGFPIQFPMESGQAPSSITLNPNVSTNISAAVGNAINRFGFTLQLTATAAGAFNWNGTYATVGD